MQSEVENPTESINNSSHMACPYLPQTKKLTPNPFIYGLKNIFLAWFWRQNGRDGCAGAGWEKKTFSDFICNKNISEKLEIMDRDV